MSDVFTELEGVEELQTYLEGRLHQGYQLMLSITHDEWEDNQGPLTAEEAICLINKRLSVYIETPTKSEVVRRNSRNGGPSKYMVTHELC